MLIHNAIITGSLLVNGTGYNTGSFSGSFIGAVAGTTATASYVEYNNVANKPALVSGSSQITYSGLTGIPSGIVSGSSQVSFNGIVDKPTLVSGSEQISFNGIVDKPTLVSGSSQITYSGLTGIPSGIVSGSAQISEFGIFATTGSNGFNGSQSITGSLTVTGQVVAQTLNVQQVTSSIVYSSGSNIFGNDVSNTQQFTGSVGMTGSLTVNGTAYFSNNVRINGNDLDLNNGSVLHRITNDNTNLLIRADYGNDSPNSTIQFSIDGTEQMRLDTNGNLGLGVTPSAWITASGRKAIEIGALGNAMFGNGASDFYMLSNAFTDGTLKYANNGPAAYYRHADAEHRWGIAGSGTAGNAISFTQAMTLDTSGRLGIGTTSPTKQLVLAANNNAVSENNTLQFWDTDTATEANQQIGKIEFYSSDTSSPGAGVKAYIGAFAQDTTPDAYIAFATQDGSGTPNPVERLRISSEGNVGIGTSSPSYRLVVNSGTDGISAGIAGSTYGIRFDNGGTFSSGMSTIHGVDSTLVGSYQPIMLNGLDVRFGTSATERMRITSDGIVLIRTTNTGADGLNINNGLNLSFSEGSGESYANIFRQRNTAATVIASGYKRSLTAGVASSFSSAMARAAIAVGYNNGSIAFFTNPSSTVANGTDMTPTERMHITSGGDIIKATHSGVDGTYDNLIKYMANGDISVNNNRWIGMDATVTAGGPSANVLRFRVYQGNAAQDQPPLTAMTLNGLGDAGIAGSLTLGTAETTNTDIRIDNATNAKTHYIFSDQSSGELGIESGASVGIKFNTNGPSTKMVILSEGNVGIGTTSPNRRLTVAGDVNFYNGTSGAGAIDPGQHEVISTGFNVAGQSSLDISTIGVTLNKWKAIVRGGFANNNEGGGLTSSALEIEVDSNNPSISVGSSSLTFSRNSSTGKLQVTCDLPLNLRITFVGTIHVINYPQSTPPTASKIILGDVRINGTITNATSYRANTFIQLTSVATKTFSVSGQTQGNFAVTDFSGVPSNAKALLVYGWYHITGYSIGSGQGDHAVSWFGLANGVSPYSWSGPGNPWPGDNSSFIPAYYGSFAMDHDGDSSVGSSDINYYGTWHNGIINVNANGTVYYTLAHGYSGGTHRIALYCVGYWV